MKSVTVREVLANDELTGAKIVAGESGLDRLVQAVTIAEIPDIANWLAGNDFVHGVGTYFENKDGSVNETRFLNWVNTIIENGASCLAIKTGRYIKTFPQSVIDLCNKKSFPLVDLPFDAVQAHINSAIYRLVFTDSTDIKDKQEQILIHFIKNVSTSKSLDQTLHLASALLNNPVLVLTEDFNILGSSFNGKGGELEVLSILGKMSDVIEDVLTSYASTDIFQEDSINNVFETTVTLKNIKQRISFKPIYKENLFTGYVCFLDQDTDQYEQLKSLFLPFANIIYLSVLQDFIYDSLSIKQKNLNYINKFTSTLLAQEFDERYSADLAKKAGIDYLQKARVILIERKTAAMDSEGNYNTQRNTSQAAALINNYLHMKLGNSQNAIVSIFHHSIVILLYNCLEIHETSEIVEGLLQILNKYGKLIHAKAGIGSVGVGVSAWHRSSMQAMNTLECMRMLDMKSSYNFYEELGDSLLISKLLQDPDLAENIINYYLGAIVEQDSDSEFKNLKILESFVRNNGSYAQTSKELFVHVNTVRYHMERIMQMLPVDIKSVDGFGAVWLAIRLNKFYEQIIK